MISELVSSRVSLVVEVVEVPSMPAVEVMAVEVDHIPTAVSVHCRVLICALEPGAGLVPGMHHVAAVVSIPPLVAVAVAFQPEIVDKAIRSAVDVLTIEVVCARAVFAVRIPVGDLSQRADVGFQFAASVLEVDLVSTAVPSQSELLNDVVT